MIDGAHVESQLAAGAERRPPCLTNLRSYLEFGLDTVSDGEHLGATLLPDGGGVRPGFRLALGCLLLLQAQRLLRRGLGPQLALGNLGLPHPLSLGLVLPLLLLRGSLGRRRRLDVGLGLVLSFLPKLLWERPTEGGRLEG